jgi:hypothetical protein
MSEATSVSQDQDKKQRLQALFERLLPLVDGVADKLRAVFFFGILVVGWIAVWLFYFKHASNVIGLSLLGVAILPLLVILQFWWSVEQLKDLPDIADQMLGDAKNEIRSSIQGLQAGNVPKLSFFSATKGLWSMGGMVMEARELFGSYVRIATLINPFMLILGVISLFSVMIMALVAVVLIFFI